MDDRLRFLERELAVDPGVIDRLRLARYRAGTPFDLEVPEGCGDYGHEVSWGKAPARLVAAIRAYCGDPVAREVVRDHPSCTRSGDTCLGWEFHEEREDASVFLQGAYRLFRGLPSLMVAEPRGPVTTFTEVLASRYLVVAVLISAAEVAADHSGLRWQERGDAAIAIAAARSWLRCPCWSVEMLCSGLIRGLHLAFAAPLLACVDPNPGCTAISGSLNLARDAKVKAAIAETLLGLVG